MGADLSCLVQNCIPILCAWHTEVNKYLLTIWVDECYTQIGVHVSPRSSKVLSVVDKNLHYASSTKDILPTPVKPPGAEGVSEDTEPIWKRQSRPHALIGTVPARERCLLLRVLFFPQGMVPGKGQMTGELPHYWGAPDKRLLPFYGPRGLGVRRRERAGVESYWLRVRERASAAALQ